MPGQTTPILMFTRVGPLAFGTMAEWSRRQTRNLVGSALVGSNPAGVDFSFPKPFFHHNMIVLYMVSDVSGDHCLLGEMDTAFPS